MNVTKAIIATRYGTNSISLYVGNIGDEFNISCKIPDLKLPGQFIDQVSVQSKIGFIEHSKRDRVFISQRQYRWCLSFYFECHVSVEQQQDVHKNHNSKENTSSLRQRQKEWEWISQYQQRNQQGRAIKKNGC